MSKQLVENCTTHHKSLKLRIYPTKEQTRLINQTFGCCRKLYNEHLQERNEFYIENILPIKSKAAPLEIQKVYKTFKPKTEKEWKVIYPYMKDVSSYSLQQARMDCDNAFVNFLSLKMAQEKDSQVSQNLSLKKIIINHIESQTLMGMLKFILKIDS